MTLTEKLLADRIIFIGTPIDGDVAAKVTGNLDALTKADQQKPISLYINSPGGTIDATLLILRKLSASKPPIHTYCLGTCRGSAVWLLAAGEKGHRSALKGSQLSIEQTISPHQDEHMRKKLDAEMAKILSASSKLQEEAILKALQTGRSFTLKEAFDAGLIDHQIEKRNGQ